MQLILPYLETIRVGTPAISTTSLLSNYRYVHFSSPQLQPIQVCGFSANFALDKVLVQLCDAQTKDVWVPFWSTPSAAMFGVDSQVSPVLPLAEPYLLTPGGKIQIKLQNTDVLPISNTIITLVGVRLIEVSRNAPAKTS